MENRNTDGADYGPEAEHGKLAELARERAEGVLANPLHLVKLGKAAAMLALINRMCGDHTECTVRYVDVAHELGASLSTVKAWADTLDKLGYVTRVPQGRNGVHIRLNPEQWPARDHSQDTAIQRAAGIIGATRTTVNAALDGALAQLQPAGGVR